MFKSKIHNLLENIIEDENDLTRRCFRAWIDGGYNGESSYRKNFERVEKANTLSKLRSFTVEQFTCFIAFEAGCSYGYAQSGIVNYFKHLDLLTGRECGEHLKILTMRLMEEIEEMFISFFPDSNRAPVTEAGENALQ
tara:strand:+ start:605 stop:1018 length:414 start_codon:yes stop_codon:yes gene_type:complete